jgi:hypothetical protein
MGKRKYHLAQADSDNQGIEKSESVWKNFKYAFGFDVCDLAAAA